MDNLQVLNKEEDEIDLLELLRKLWQAKKTILIVVFVFFVLGLLMAILSPKEYTATTIIVPQTSGNSKLGGSLGGLAAMAGVNLGKSSTEDIPPTLYPKLATSIPFKRKLLQTPLYFETLGKSVSYQEYYWQYAKPSTLDVIKKYTIGLPALLFSKKEENTSEINHKQEQIISLNRQEEGLHHLIDAQLKLNVNEKEGFVTLNYSMPEALAAAQMLQRAQELLQNSIIEFKVKKAKEELQFTEQLYLEAEKDFKAKQYALANFQDRNRNFSSSLPQTRLQQLQTEFNLAYGVYSEMAKQFENQKIKVKEETPAFTVIEPVSVPNEKSKPKRGMIIAIWTFLGSVLGIGSVFLKDFIRQLKAEKV
ncbi:capsule biosynthesis protein [Capnocytophaga canimorsus]|uniref:Wzz/FepE/Etk N-terminal domain-containing protein n=1 Tax=Capnocytophaga canimorsus TaxID=28188 RepID=UPI000D6DF526|nr:Wzz/FepE/Etk N-terminal domain-containing protein [Capnocytophaga canimorsus]AWL78138.1 capsule biosynthesis protein [Capnocytophaga canimorsus]MDT9499456.1 capsule biosynthesis protein [Capnocytophaga canimorsus]